MLRKVKISEAAIIPDLQVLRIHTQKDLGVTECFRPKSTCETRQSSCPSVTLDLSIAEELGQVAPTCL